MKIFQQLKYVLAAVFASAAMALCGASSVSAADVPDYRLQISPAKEDIGDLKPGETYTGVFKVQNTGAKDFNFKVSVTPYSVADQYYSTNEESNQYTDIVEWVKFSQTSGHVDPNGEVEITYTVTVPADVPAGGQYALLTAELVNESGSTDGSGLTTINRVGMILYSNVQGNTRKTASVIENKVPSFLLNPPVQATSIVENTGNTHTNAKYVLQVYPLFGDEEVYTNEENPTTLTILPETQRFNTITWPNAPHLGIFRVKQTVTIFDKVSVTEKVVFLCPIWFLFIIIALIFCAIFWIVTRIRARRQDRR
jgi:hypothetical protein